MAKPLDHLLQKDMDRKEFLLTMGFGFASILGFSTIIHLLSGKSSVTSHSQLGFKGRPIRSSGFGSSNYGNRNVPKKTA
jgi:hypothetical protein